MRLKYCPYTIQTLKNNKDWSLTLLLSRTLLSTLYFSTRGLHHRLAKSCSDCPRSPPTSIVRRILGRVKKQIRSIMLLENSRLLLFLSSPLQKKSILRCSTVIVPFLGDVCNDAEFKSNIAIVSQIIQLRF